MSTKLCVFERNEGTNAKKDFAMFQNKRRYMDEAKE